MKLKKKLAIAFSLTAMGAAVPAAVFAFNGNANATNSNAVATVSFKAPSVAKLGGSGSSSFLDTMLDNVAEGGFIFIGKKAGEGVDWCVTQILKNYGIDFRDSSIQYLDRIEGEIKAIKGQLNAISGNADKYNAERSLDNLYSYASFASTDVMNQVKGGLWSLAALEKDTSKTASYVEEQRKSYFENSLKNFSIKGSNVSDFVTHFANTIVTPVESNPTNDLFHYYQLSVGRFDKWSTQSYVNRRKFIGYLDSLLITSANLAAFDYHYRTQGADVGSKAVADERFNAMVESVEKANEVFKKELNRLNEYEILRQKGELIYLPTGTHYSNKMATLTFNHDDKERQLLLKGVESTIRGTPCLQHYMLTYQTNHSMVNSVAEDFKDYVKSHGLKNYTINQYLKDIGFTADRADLFDKAAGLYYGEVNISHSGYLEDDLSVKAHYFDKDGELQNKTQFFLEAHHRFLRSPWFNVKYSDSDYYLNFVKADGSLDGNYMGNVYCDGTNSDLVNAFSSSLKNRVNSDSDLVRNVKYQ